MKDLSKAQFLKAIRRHGMGWEGFAGYVRIPLSNGAVNRCIDCGHYFEIRPAGVNLDQEGEAGEKLIWDSDHKLAQEAGK